MTPEQQKKLENMKYQEHKLITVDDLENKNNRTLLFGYNCDRDAWHVYLKDGKIYTYRYNKYNEERNMLVDVKSNDGFNSFKRFYPERCDYEFCKLMLERDALNTSFTGRTEGRVLNGIYYGKIYK